MNNLKISKRIDSLDASPIRKFLPLVIKAEKQGVEVLKINVGDPDTAIPAEMSKGISQFKDKNIHYAPSPGIKEHVEAWIRYYRGFGVKLRPEEIIPTVGVSEGILMAFLTVCNPGDELIVFEPLYASYKEYAKMCGVNLRAIKLNIEDGFALPSAGQIQTKITKRTKAIVVINPDNPTGKVWTKKEFEIVKKVALKNGLYILSDETYREIVFNGKPSSMFFLKGIENNLIVMDSISKRFSAPGIRLGVICSKNKEFMASILKIAMSRLSAPTVGQLATIKILKNSKSYTKKLVEEFKKRRDVVNKVLATMSEVKTHIPNGAFYQVVKLPVKNSEDFIRFMLEKFRYKQKTILISPMEGFYVTKGEGRDEIRIAYVLNTKDLKMAMEIFKMGLEKYLKYDQEI